MLAIEVGGMNHVPYARAFNETDTRITLNQRVMAVRPEAGRLCVEIGSDHSAHRSVRHVDHVVGDHGTAANDGLYHELRPSSTNLGAVDHAALLAGPPAAASTRRPTPTARSSCSASATPSPAATSTPPSTTPCGCSRTCSRTTIWDSGNEGVDQR